MQIPVARSGDDCVSFNNINSIKTTIKHFPLSVACLSGNAGYELVALICSRMAACLSGW